MKYLSLFSGIGGFELGIQQAYETNQSRAIEQRGESGGDNIQRQGVESNNISGDSRLCDWTCIGYSEIDKYAIATYQKHYPTHHNYGDITRINADELPDFDLLVGGFPCQAFSIAGKRQGFEDTRGTLFFEIARILKSKQPRLFLLENVKGLLSHDNGQTFKVIIATLDELGYDLQWQVLNSKNHGVPQNRERVFIVGHLRGTRRPEVFPFTTTTGNDIEVVGELSSETWTKRNESTRRVYGVEGVAPTIPTAQGGGVMAKIVVPRNRRTEFVESDISSTLTSHYRGAPDGDGRPGLREDMTIRRLTPTECERLIGLPDGWTKYGIIETKKWNDKTEIDNNYKLINLSDTQRYKLCGNGVVVNVVEEIIKKLLFI